MKLNFKSVLSSLVASLFIFTLTSCNDDNGVKPGTEKTDDLTGGYNSIIVDLNKIPDVLLTLPVKDEVEIEISDNSSFPFNYEVTKNQDGFSQINLLGLKGEPAEDYLETFDLKVSGKDKRSKIVKIIVRRIIDNQNADDETDGEPGTLMWYDYIGRSFQPWASYGSTKRAILDVPFAYLEVGSGDGLDWETAGTRFSQTMTDFSANVGLSFKGPGGTILRNDCIFKGGVDFGISGSAMEAVNFEYYFGIISKEMANASIDEKRVKGNLSDLLRPYVNDVFNNDYEGSPYWDYDNNSDESMMEFLDDYGTYVILKGSFGGAYIHIYNRLELEYQHSIAVDMSADLRSNLTDDNQLKTFVDVWRAKNGNYLDVNADFSYYNSQYQEMTKAYGYDLVKGGNRSNDISSWDASVNMDDEKGWVLTRYCTDASDTETIIPIYELITKEERREAVKRVFIDYFNKHINEKQEWHLVLADFYMKADDGDHNPLKNVGESFIDEGPDGYKYFYYPMMANKNFPVEDDRSHPAETCQNDFIHCAVPGGHYWYYALGYHELGALGIQEIRLYDPDDDDDVKKLENEEKRGIIWERRGDNANEGVDWNIHNNYVYLHLAHKETALEDKIRAAALALFDGSSIGSYPNIIIASTGGTEWQHPWEEGKSAFEQYWDKTNTLHDDRWMRFYNRYGVTPSLSNEFTILFSKKPLPLETEGLSWGVGAFTNKIQHPDPWVK